MKFTRLQLQNILAIRDIDVKLDQPVAFFVGANGAAKSSIRDAVQMAVTRAPMRDITNKKDYQELVRDGEKAGGAQVVVDGDLDNSYAFNMPAGIFSGPEITDSMRVAMDGQRFAAMDSKQRYQFLFDLTGCAPKSENMRERLLARKCDMKKVDTILPLLRTGLPSICEHAKNEATKAKGAWKAVTNAVWGSKVGAAWKAPMPDAPIGDAEALALRLEDLDAHLATLNESMGTIKALYATATSNAQKRVALQGAAANADEIAGNLERAQNDLKEYEPKVLKLRERAKGAAARTGLVHDMAKFIDACEYKPEDEDACEALLDRYEAEHGPLAGGKPDVEAQAELPAHESGLTVMQNRVKNLQRDLDAAKMAKGQFDALAPDETLGDESEDINEIDGLLAKAKADRQAVVNQILDIEAATKNRAEAEKKNKDATAHNNDIETWLTIAAALAPDGIPSELLTESLAPVNTALAQAAEDTGWPLVLIEEDMTIRCGGRRYQMQSKSFQWRANAMIAQVVAVLSGLKLLMLDEVDILDLPARKQLLEWIDLLATNDEIDTALLFATLKDKPRGLQDTISVFWVEDGYITDGPQVTS